MDKNIHWNNQIILQLDVHMLTWHQSEVGACIDEQITSSLQVHFNGGQNGFRHYSTFPLIPMVRVNRARGRSNINCLLIELQIQDHEDPTGLPVQQVWLIQRLLRVPAACRCNSCQVSEVRVFLIHWCSFKNRKRASPYKAQVSPL